MNHLLSIIIPTLNEVNFLKNILKDLLGKAQKPNCLEIIIVDAGSIDGTLESIKDYNISTFSKPSFQLKKYESLNFGIENAKGQYLLFLDADTTLPSNFDLLISQKLKEPNVVGGAFEFAFANPDWKMKIIQLVNLIRYRFSHIYYGDQAMFCKKEAAVGVGGFPKKRLMETAYFCQELKKRGKLCLITTPVKTSPRRFIENGFIRVCWFDITMWMRFLLHLSVEEYGEKYWSTNLNPINLKE